MAKKKVKAKKHAKPNVFMQSYEVAKSGGDTLSTVARPSSKRRMSQSRRHLLRERIHVNTLSQELKRMGIITAGVGSTLIVLAIVLNLVN